MYVAILGNENPKALPVVELDLSNLPKGVPRIAGTEVKWRRDSKPWRSAHSVIPEDLSEKTLKKIQHASLAAYQALEMRDYGRIDLRLTEDGRIYVLEVNPNPWLHTCAEVVIAAEESEMTYEALIDKIVELALAR